MNLADHINIGGGFGEPGGGALKGPATVCKKVVGCWAGMKRVVEDELSGCTDGPYFPQVAGPRAEGEIEASVGVIKEVLLVAGVVDNQNAGTTWARVGISATVSEDKAICGFNDFVSKGEKGG